MGNEQKRVSVVFSVKADEFKKNLADTNSQIKLTQSELKLASSRMKEYGSNTETLGNKQKALEQQIKNLTDRTKLYEDSVSKNIKKLEENRKELTNLEDEKKKIAVEYKNAIKLYGEESQQAQNLKVKLEDVTNKYKDKKDAIRDNVNAINKHSAHVNKTESELSNLQAELKKTNEEISINSNKFIQAAKDYEKASKKLKSIGDGISTVGSGLMKIGSVGATAGVAIGKMSMDFEKGIANINTLLDDTSNLEGYKKTVMEVSNDTGKDLGDMTNGMYQAISSIGDLGKETESIFKVMAGSAKAGGAETADSVSLISAGMKGYNSISKETAQTISDLAFNTAKLGVTTFPEMAKSMQPLFPLSSSLNMSMVDLFTNMATLTGVTGNTAEVSTQLKAVFSNLLKPTEEMGKMMQKYGYSNGQAMIKTEGFTGVLEILRKETGGNADKLGKLFSSTEALTAMTALCGVQYDTFIEKNKSMQNVAGATDTALNKVANTGADRLTKSINKLKNSVTASGDKLIPLVDGLSDGITGIANAIGKLDAKTVANIVKMSAMSLAMGGVLKVTGSLTKGFGGLIGFLGKCSGKIAETDKGSAALGKTMGGLGLKVSSFTTIGLPAIGVIAGVGTAMYAAKEATEFYNSTITKSTEEMGLIEKAMASMNGTATYSRKELDEMGLTYKNWNENVSPETQKELEDISKKFRDLQNNIDLVNLDGVLSEDERKAVTKQFDTLFTEINEKIKNNKSDIQKNLEEVFKADGKVDENEKKVTEILEKNKTEQLNKLKDFQTKYTGILEDAAKNNRELTQEEYEELKKIKEEMENLALENTVKSQEELLAAKADFLSRSNTMDVESLSQWLTQHATAREEEKKRITTNYDDAINKLKLHLANCSEEEQKAINDEIAHLEQQKKDTLNLQDGKYLELIRLIQEKNPELLKEINIGTGNILTNTDKFNREMIEKAKGMYLNLNTISSTGYHLVYNTHTQEWERVYAEVDSVTGEITTIYGNTLGWIGDNPMKPKAEIEDALRQMGSMLEDYFEYKRKIESKPIIIKAKKPNMSDEMSYATGGTVPRSGLSNVNENGWELFDNITRSAGVLLGNEMAYLNSGTKVTNHLASTAMMRRDIQSEVSRQLSVNINDRFEELFKKLIVGNNFENKKTVEIEQQLIFQGKVESPYEVAKAARKSVRDLKI